METQNQGQKKGGGSLWIILLLISVILNIYQWRNHTTQITSYEQKVDTLYVERTNIEKELTDARTELNKYWGINAKLDSLLKEANTKIDAQEKTIHKIKGEEKNYSTLNKKLQE